MRNLKVNHQNCAKFIPAEKAKHYNTFSLASSAPKKDHLIDSLNALSEDMSIALRHEILKIASDPQIKVELSDFFEKAPEDSGLIQTATSSSDSQAKAFMHIQPGSFGALSELFFGGSPSNISTQDQSKKPITDTEKRLATRLFNVFVGSITTAFNKSDEIKWTERWVERLKESEVLWTTATFSSEDGWDFSISFAWPQAVNDEDESESSPNDVDFTDALTKALVNVPFKLKTVIAKSSINITDIANLKKGDILPISLPSQVSAKSGNNAIVSGSMCEHNERLGLKIEYNSVGVSYE